MSTPRIVAAVLAIIALLVCLIAPLSVLFSDPANYEENFRDYLTMFNWATILWFISAPFWLVPEIFQKK